MIFIFRSQQRVWGSSLQSECPAWKSGKWLKDTKTFWSIKYQWQFFAFQGWNAVSSTSRKASAQHILDEGWPGAGHCQWPKLSHSCWWSSHHHPGRFFNQRLNLFSQLIECSRFAPRTFPTTAVWLRTWSIDGSALQPSWKLWVSYFSCCFIYERIDPLSGSFISVFELQSLFNC